MSKNSTIPHLPFPNHTSPSLKSSFPKSQICLSQISHPTSPVSNLPFPNPTSPSLKSSSLTSQISHLPSHNPISPRPKSHISPSKSHISYLKSHISHLKSIHLPSQIYSSQVPSLTITYYFFNTNSCIVP
jgi:hypothetical protein